MEGEGFFLCTMSFLSSVEGSGNAHMKRYRATRSKLVMHLEVYDHLKVGAKAV